MEAEVRRLYLILAVLGAVVPYYFFISFLSQHGLNLGELVEQRFANVISTFFAVDLLLTTVVFLVYLGSEGRRQAPAWWVYAVATLLDGPSFTVPLFLYARKARARPTSS
jgi:hypothetical protein